MKVRLLKREERKTPVDSAGSRDGSGSREQVLDKILARIDRTKTEADHKANIDMILKRTSAGKQPEITSQHKNKIVPSKGLSATATVKSLKVKIKTFSNNKTLDDNPKSVAS